MSTTRPRHRSARRRTVRRNRTRVAVLAGLVVAVVAAAVIVVSSGSSSDPGKAVTTATGFDLPSLDGSDRVRLAAFEGTPVVVNFFASWCTTCDAELPEFRAAADRLEGKVAFVFVNSNDAGNGKDMAKRHGILGFPVAVDVGGNGDNGLYRSLGGPGGMPITAFYDESGAVVDVVFGGLLDGALEEEIQRLFGVSV